MLYKMNLEVAIACSFLKRFWEITKNFVNKRKTWGEMQNSMIKRTIFAENNVLLQWCSAGLLRIRRAILK